MTPDEIKTTNKEKFDDIYKKTTNLLLLALPGLISIKTFGLATPLLLFNAAYYPPLLKFVSSFSEELIKYKNTGVANFKTPLTDAYASFNTMTQNDNLAFIIGSIIITQFLCNLTFDEVPEYCLDFKSIIMRYFDDIKNNTDLTELKELCSQYVNRLIDSLPHQ